MSHSLGCRFALTCFLQAKLYRPFGVIPAYGCPFDHLRRGVVAWPTKSFWRNFSGDRNS